MRQALRGKASRDEVTDFGDGKKGATRNGRRRNERGIEYEAVYRELDQSSSQETDDEKETSDNGTRPRSEEGKAVGTTDVYEDDMEAFD